MTQKRKSFNFKDTIKGLLGQSNAASGSAGDGGERIIHLNSTELNDQQKFLHNRVFTAKYTAFSFLPKFLYEEFSKYANLFFLFISGIQVRHFIMPRFISMFSFNFFFFFFSKFRVFHLLVDIPLLYL